MQFSTYFKLLVIIIILESCGGKTNTQLNLSEKESNERSVLTDADKAKIEKTIYSVPSPVQAALLLEKTGARYDNQYMNPATNVTSYQTSTQIALNIGVYGADLAYVNVYKKHVEALKYFATIQKLGDKIGIGYLFTPALMQRFEKNQGNQDSLIGITTESFTEVNHHLKKNGQDELISLMLVGGWLEALYISCEIWSANNNAELARLIAEQKFSLNDILEVVKTSKSEDLKKIQSQLNRLKSSFDKITSEYSYKETVQNKEKKLAVINNKTRLNYKESNIKEIQAIVKKIRSTIV